MPTVEEIRDEITKKEAERQALFDEAAAVTAQIQILQASIDPKEAALLAAEASAAQNAALLAEAEARADFERQEKIDAQAAATAQIAAAQAQLDANFADLRAAHEAVKAHRERLRAQLLGLGATPVN